MTTANLSERQRDGDKLPRVLRILGVIERIGNALPHPFWLFWILAAILAVISAIMSASGVSVISPSDGEEVVVPRVRLSGRAVM
ncbi:AbgT family transporter [Kocuria palustris]|uniref:AbgT family transporter n=1 Tax=Kocuria palustris TaxID=71999 RepID=UPI003CE6C5E5